MRKVFLFAIIAGALMCSEARAQEPALDSSLAFPGSFWIAAGDVGPAEPDNTVGQAVLEQGLTVWHRGAWFVGPFAAVSLTADSLGYEWNNKHPTTVGAKVRRRIGNGVIQAGGGIMFERDPATGRDRHPSAFVGYWAGWQRDARAHTGASRFSFPGSLNVSSGLMTGRDPDNWMTDAAVQQGVVAQRWGGAAIVPYAGLAAGIDTKKRIWQNRVTGDAGLKVVHAITGGVMEIGVAQRHQYERLTGRRTSAPIAFVNFWIGWNPSRTSVR